MASSPGSWSTPVVHRRRATWFPGPSLERPERTKAPAPTLTPAGRGLDSAAGARRAPRRGGRRSRRGERRRRWARRPAGRRRRPAHRGRGRCSGRRVRRTPASRMRSSRTSRRPRGSGSVAIASSSGVKPGIVALVDLVAEAGKPLAGAEALGDHGFGTVLLAVDEQLVDELGGGAVQRALDHGQSGDERLVGRRPGRAGDTDGQRARRQLVVGQQDERTVDDVDERLGGLGPPAARQTLRHRPVRGAVRLAQHGRNDAEEPAGRGRSVVVGMARAEGAGHGDQRRQRRTAHGAGHAVGPAPDRSALATARRRDRGGCRSTAARRPARSGRCGPARRRRGRGSGRRPRRAR